MALPGGEEVGVSVFVVIEVLLDPGCAGDAILEGEGRVVGDGVGGLSYFGPLTKHDA